MVSSPCVCFLEGTYEGGGPALPVRPEEASSRGPRGRAERLQRPSGLPLPKPFPLPQENQCEPPNCTVQLMHYLTHAGLIDVEGRQQNWEGKMDGSLKYIIYLDEI